MHDHVDAFLEYLTLNRGCSANTVRAYRADLVQAVAFFRERLGHDPRPAELTKQLVREFLAAQAAGNFAATTVARRLATLGSFCRYLRRQGLIASCLTWGLKTPKLDRTLPHVLTRDEVALLLEMPMLSLSPLDAVAGALSFSGALALRDKAVLEVLYSTGCRAAELVGLDLADLDLDAGLARVRGKGKRERVVVLGPPAVRALRAWLEVRPTLEGPARDAVFLSARPGRRGKTGGSFRWRLTTRQLDRLFAAYVERAGLDPRTTPHTLRHSFGAHLLDAGANLRGVQALLGHKKLSMTGWYCQVSIRRLHEAHARAHPLAGSGPAAPPAESSAPASAPPAESAPSPPRAESDPAAVGTPAMPDVCFGFSIDTDGRTTGAVQAEGEHVEAVEAAADSCLGGAAAQSRTPAGEEPLAAAP